MLHEKDRTVKSSLARAHDRPQAGDCTDRQGTPVALPTAGLTRTLTPIARNLVFARMGGESMGGVSGDGFLYARADVPYEELGEGIVRWQLRSGRRFVFDNGTVFVWDGIVYLGLTLVPDWRTAIQFSLGYDAGRTVRPLWNELLPGKK